jgi:hypothetical protein
MSFEKPFREDPVRSLDRTPALSKIFLFERRELNVQTVAAESTRFLAR